MSQYGPYVNQAGSKALHTRSEQVAIIQLRRVGVFTLALIIMITVIIDGCCVECAGLGRRAPSCPHTHTVVWLWPSLLPPEG